jgi:hypothetical protein
MSSCIAIVAAVCFHSFQTATLHDLGLRAEVDVSVGEAIATIQIRSDQILTLDWRRLPGACAHSRCVAYFRHCVSAAGKAQCSYHFEALDADFEQEVDISAKDMEQIRAASQEISVLPNIKEPDDEIALASLSIEADSAAPPYCRVGGPMADCWPHASRARGP